MIFHMASAKLTNVRCRLIQLSGWTMVTAWAKRSSKHQNIEYFISAQKLKTYQSSDWKKSPFMFSLRVIRYLSGVFVKKISFHVFFAFMLHVFPTSKKSGGGGGIFVKN